MSIRRVGESSAKEGLGGAIVWGSIECSDSKGECAVNYGGCGEEERIGVVLGVEGSRTAD